MTERATVLRMRLPGRAALPTRVQEHIQEVLDRDPRWKLRGQWPTLDAHSPGYAYIIVHDPYTDTWGRSYIGDGDSVDAPAADLARRRWSLGYYSAAAAADEIEQLVGAGEVLA